jgi:hypothetical protein
VALLREFQRGAALCGKGLRFAQRVKDLYCIGFAEMTYGLWYVPRGEAKETIIHGTNALFIPEV